MQTLPCPVPCWADDKGSDEDAAPVVPAVTKACGELQRTAAYEALPRGSITASAAAAELASKGSTVSAPSAPAVTACRSNSSRPEDGCQV